MVMVDEWEGYFIRYSAVLRGGRAEPLKINVWDAAGNIFPFCAKVSLPTKISNGACLKKV